MEGQSVYQLLPPPYRDVWLEWSDAEKQAAQLEKSKENKVCFCFAFLQQTKNLPSFHCPQEKI